MVTSQEIVERSFYISLLHQTLIRGLTINPENYLVKNEDGLWVPTRELNDQYIHDKEAIETELTKKGSGFYYIFGVGNNQSRGNKDLPRITLDLTAWYPGEIGLEKETNELDEASGLYQVIDYDYEPKSSRIDVHLCANNQQEMRILHEIMYRALPSRGYIKPYLNDYESWKNSKFSPSGNIYIEVGNFYDHDDLQQGFLEKVYTYEVRDGLLNPEIIAEITPIADISVLIDSALTLHVPELPYDKTLISNVDNIKFVHKPRYSYLSHTEPEDYQVDLGSTINTGNKYIAYKETTIDPYIVPITITQNNQDVTDMCTFSFPTDKNISMAYEDGNLIFTVKSIIPTQFDAEVVVTKGDQSISITFSVNFTIAIHEEIPNYVASDIFDVTKKLPLTLYGKAVGKSDILANGIWHGPSFTIEQDAPWPLNFGTLTVKDPKNLHLSMADFTYDEETKTYSYGIDEDTTIFIEYKLYNADNKIQLEKRVRTYNNIDYYGVQCKGLDHHVMGWISPRLGVSKGSIENIKAITINYAVYVDRYDEEASIFPDLSNSGESEDFSLNPRQTFLLTYTYNRISEIPWKDYEYYPEDPPLCLIAVPVPAYFYEWTVLGISDIYITFN